MQTSWGRAVLAGWAAVLLTSCSVVPAGAARPALNAAPQAGWQSDFNLENRKLADTGEAKYFVLKPGFQITLESATAVLLVTVLDETKVFSGITTRVVEEREEVNGQLAEIARNFYAIDPANGDAFYFGEDVDYYKDGKVSGHAGTWKAYENGSMPGLIMPGTPTMGMKYYQELAPGVAMDRAEITSVTDTYKTPAGAFTNIVVTRESSQIDPAVERKTYAPGIGIIQDEDMKLVRYGYVSAPARKSSPVPNSLTTIEAQAEDIMDVVPQSAWPNVQADIAAIDAAWMAFRKQAASDGVTPSGVAAFEKALTNLKSAGASKDAPSTLQAANDVSAGVVEMMALYDTPAPADIGRLDVLLRQVILDIARKDAKAANGNFTRMQTIWKAVKPVVLARGGKADVEQFEQSLAKQAQLLAAKDSAGFTSEVRVALEIVDALERVFAR